MEMTMREARQRCALNGIRLSKIQDTGEFRVTLAELYGNAAEDAAYYSDDIEDAVLSGAAMRATANKRAA